jgi:CDGSH-type Zn-finger protein
VTSRDGTGDAPASRHRPSLTCYPDGPVLVRGDIDLYGPDGTVLPRRRRTVALCRCGHSALAPWCDGTHKLVGVATRRRRGTGAEVSDDEQDEKVGDEENAQ